MGLLDIGVLPNLDILGIFMCHFALATWVLLDGVSSAFLFYSIILLIVLLWCIKDSQNELPLMIAIRINVVCVLFDFWILFDTFHLNFFGLVFFVGRLFNLFLRFVTIPLLSRMCSDKTGGINDGLPEALIPIFGVDQGTVAREPYENIDNAPHQSYPKSEPVIGNTGSFSFTSTSSQYQA